jgi:hypothetical protein
VNNVLEVREGFGTYQLELTSINLGGDCIKNQLLGLPGRDQETESVRRTTHSSGDACKEGTPSPVAIIDQWTTYWAPTGPSWHPGYERLPVGRGGDLLQTFDSERIRGELDDRPAGEATRDPVWSRITYF